MATTVNSPSPTAVEMQRTLGFLWSELKPKGKLLTPFNLISIPIMLLGAGLLGMVVLHDGLAFACEFGHRQFDLRGRHGQRHALR